MFYISDNMYSYDSLFFPFNEGSSSTSASVTVESMVYKTTGTGLPACGGGVGGEVILATSIMSNSKSDELYD